MRSFGGYVWADSPLHRAPAAAKLAGLVAGAVLVLAVRGPITLAVVLVAIAALGTVSRVGWRRLIAPLWGMHWFLLVIVALNALLFSSAEPLFSLGPLHLTVPGIERGLWIAARTCLVVVLGAMLTATTTPQQVVDGVRDLLRPLARLGVPTETAALAVGVTAQFVPTLLRESQQLMRAQELRCGGFAARGIMRRAVSYVRLLVPVFVCAVRRADELSRAMEARGYRVDGQRCTTRERGRS